MPSLFLVMTSILPPTSVLLLLAARLKAWEQTGLRASCEAARQPAGSSGEQLSLQRSLARAEEQAI